ncbi:MAG: AsmA family protein [Acidobacteriales bacterium]|nr:AsmA family protein [Terriglobales bacterium]
MSGRWRRRWVLALLLVLAAALFLPPVITLKRFHKDLQTSLSRALGRNVSFRENIGFRLLPQPAFVLENFVLSDDPAFGPEPMLRAETVTARLRLSSLWRGRLEIARLTFDYPSWNLVRNEAGRWNLESLLQRTSQVPTAPTAASRAQAAPRFPYIETDNGRINVKLGAEKLAHGLADTDIALWQGSEDAWNLRLEGTPVRTDAYMTDTGTVRIEGSFTRSKGEPIEQTPFDYRLEWEKAQLGQITALLSGRDRGWRGDVDLTAHAQGTLDQMRLESRLNVRDFRRYDISSRDALGFAAECTANFSKRGGAISPEVSAPLLLSALDCKSPVRGGEVALRGAWSFVPGGPYQINLFAAEIPADLLADLYRHAKNRERRRRAGGSGRITGLQLSAPSQKTDFLIGDLTFGFTPTPAHQRKADETAPLALTISPFPLPLGGAKPVIIAPTVTAQSATVRMKGTGEIKSLLAAAKTFGLVQRDYEVGGIAQLDLAVVAPFTGFAAPHFEGEAQLSSVTFEAAGIPAPLVIRAAGIQMDANGVYVEKLSGQLTGTHVQFDGRLGLPIRCSAGPCADSFDLRLTDVDFDELNRLFNPAFRTGDWMSLPRRLFGGDGETNDSLLRRINARGKLTVNRLIMRSLIATGASANVAISGGQLRFTDVRGEALAGKHVGEWTADFSGDTPAYSGSGEFSGAQAASLAALTKENWGTGTISGRYRLTLNGTSAAALRQSAAGRIDFTWKNGLLRRVLWEGAPLGFTDWTGKAAVESEKVTLTSGTMHASGGKLETSGIITFDRELDLLLSGPASDLHVSGAFERPALKFATRNTEEASSTRK